MKTKVSLEIGDAACGIDCIVLYDNDDRLIKSISEKQAKKMEEAINQHEKLKDEVKELRDAIESVIKLQKENYGDGMLTHIKLIGRAKELKNLLTKYNKEQ